MSRTRVGNLGNIQASKWSIALAQLTSGSHVCNVMQENLKALKKKKKEEDTRNYGYRKPVQSGWFFQKELAIFSQFLLDSNLVTYMRHKEVSPLHSLQHVIMAIEQQHHTANCKEPSTQNKEEQTTLRFSVRSRGLYTSVLEFI